MRNSYIKAALKYTKATVVRSWEENYYDANNNTINLNFMDSEPLVRAIKQILGRPRSKDFSLAHELGHAVYEKMDLGSKKRFQHLFGESDVYRGGLWPLILSSFDEDTEERNTLTAYGASDPEEDFADCFAYQCVKNNRKPKHRNPVVLKKLLYVKQILDRVERSK